MGNVVSRFANLSPEQRQFVLNELRAQGRDAKKNGHLQAPPIVRASRPGPLPLSFAQQRLWFLDQLEPGNSAYNMLAGVRLNGPLRVAALEQSLNHVIRRHEILRTTFTSPEGRPIQLVAPSLTIPLRLDDLQSLDVAEREAAVRTVMQAEGRGTFDLKHGPLLRATLLRLGSEEHVLVVALHHIVADGWSLGVLIKEVAAIYAAVADGRPVPLPELPIQYADYAVWQREWLSPGEAGQTGQALSGQLEYWKKQLEGLAGLELPTDRPRPRVQTFRGTTYGFQISGTILHGLKEVAQQTEATLFIVLLAAFQVLLKRYTGQKDIVVGSPIAGRHHRELEGLIGLLVNTLVLRTNLAGNPTFLELVARVRETALGAYAHQDVPFEMLVEELQPDRDLSRSPLFQIMFILQNAPLTTLRSANLTLTPLEGAIGGSKFDLTLSMIEWQGGLHGTFEYNTDLYDAATMVRLAEHFETLLAGIVAEPTRRLSELPLLSEMEQQQLLSEWNDTPADYPRDHCIHELFQAQALRSPDAVAVAFQDHQLTYAALDARANQLAHYLQALGVQPETLVGLCVERSIEMLVGLLGILQAGGAYVPLDPAYPQARLAFMLQDSGARVLLTQQHLLEQLPRATAHVVCLDRDWPEIAYRPTTAPRARATVENLAYTIYTSGSTGQPKGVQIPQRAVVNLIASMAQQPGVATGDILLSVTTLSFDIAALELFVPLAVGARVELTSRASAMDGQQLLQVLAASGATVMQATPATWRLLIAAGWAGHKGLKLLCGGEALPADLAAELGQRSAALWNVYGPTETTIWSCRHLISSGERTISIGRPIANTTAYVLDAELQPTPLGVPGELYLGGVGVARGYLNRPELTAERFVPNPFSATEDARRMTENDSGSGLRRPSTVLRPSKEDLRLYRTGDLVRYLPDGNLEFLGRLDQQVKLRGYRIEPGEIEAVLGAHPALRQAVVIVREDVPGDKRLVAYVVPAGESVPESSELQSYLSERLPSQMVPSVFLVLESLPLTPNGKLDRRALPAPDSALMMERDYIAPRTRTEEILAGIWSEVLQRKPIGAFDNFFALGGHSLLATLVMSKVSDTFGVQLPIRQLFEFPTVAELARAIAKQQLGEALDQNTASVEAVLSEVENLSDEQLRLLLAE